MIQRALSDAVDRIVTVEELRCAVAEPIPDDEREHVIALVRWFTTRYPSPEARLSYVRQAYRRWRPSSEFKATKLHRGLVEEGARGRTVQEE